MNSYMDKEQQIHDEVEKTLQAFDPLPRLAPNPYLFTRVQARWNTEKGMQRQSMIPLAGLKALALIIILILNLVTAIYCLHTDREASSQEQLVSSLSRDYTISHADYFWN